ncbi:MAG: FAD-dependent oxidoreductase, partial [Planctomycetaceae bacterium]|nr:FAD-dependent oxidoreductase [Planctomycetaceae bacterium]
MRPHDVTIVGGGIVGLATAYAILQQRPETTLTLLEKESEVAQHQTGHNSGVIHSGIYYRPGSLRAVNCRAGKLLLEEFCHKHEIPFELCGKVIVATEEKERASLHSVYERGLANGVRCQL